VICADDMLSEQQPGGQQAQQQQARPLTGF
jgi:hypothetical protein